MDPIQLLMEEHRLLEKVIDAFEAFGGSFPDEGKLDQTDLERFARFIREYAHDCHHDKEEKILFRAMAKNGIPDDSGPLGCMFEEHSLGREYTAILFKGTEAGDSWPPALQKKVHRAIVDYTEMLRSHIRKEERILYPLAAANLGTKLMKKVAGDFTVREEALEADGSKMELEKLAAELIAQYCG